MKIIRTAVVLATASAAFLGSVTLSWANQACMQQFANAAKAKNIGAELYPNEVWIEAPTGAPLRPFKAAMDRCLDAAYAKKGVLPMARNTKAIVWQQQTASGVDWCATATVNPDMIGGNGPLREWYSSLYVCKTGQPAVPNCVPGVAC